MAVLICLNILKWHSTQLKNHQAQQEQFFIQMQTLFKKAKRFLVWMMLVFVVVFVLLGVMAIVYKWF